MFTKGQWLLIGVTGFFLFFFALALGATLAEDRQTDKITARCMQEGGAWNPNGFCEKNLNVCEPQNI